MILYSDLNDNLNNRRMEYSPLFRRSSVIPLETTIIQEVTPSTTSNSNVAITKSMDKSNTMETTTNVPENKPSSTSTTSTLLLVASSGIATSLLAYGAFKMKARLLQLLTT